MIVRHEKEEVAHCCLKQLHFSYLLTPIACYALFVRRLWRCKRFFVACTAYTLRQFRAVCQDIARCKRFFPLTPCNHHISSGRAGAGGCKRV